MAFIVLTIALGGALVMHPANVTNVGAFHPSTNLVPSATVDPRYHDALAVVRLSPTALAKVTGVIVTARVRLRAAAGCEAHPLRPAQRKFFRCLGVKRPVS